MIRGIDIHDILKAYLERSDDIETVSVLTGEAAAEKWQTTLRNT